MSYLGANVKSLSPEDSDLVKSVREVAKNVMRPVSMELDGMTPEEVIAPDSPFWKFMKTAYELGWHKMAFPDKVGNVKLGGLDLSPFQQYLVMEEMGWGSYGLALAASQGLPAVTPLIFCPDDEEMLREFTVPYCECTDGKVIGIWGITEPDCGSDVVCPGMPIFRDPYLKPQCSARMEGDEWVINGQKSAWVASGTIGTHCILCCNVDPSRGQAGCAMFLFKLDKPGITRGAPLDKIGLRDLNQGEVFFDNLRIPKKYMIVGPDKYEEVIENWLSMTTTAVATWSVGLARAAFEEALDYARKRKQGGKAIIEHSFIRAKLFNMYAKVEAARQLIMEAFIFNRTSPEPRLEYGYTAKVYGAQVALEVAADAVQIWGAAGITKEYLVGKLFRDARLCSICDGSSDTFSVVGGYLLNKRYPGMK
jgi:acyl-CoA dehydrogenase